MVVYCGNHIENINILWAQYRDLRIKDGGTISSQRTLQQGFLNFSLAYQ